MKMNGAIAGDSTTGRKKFRDRQWAALIGFVVLKPGSRFKKIGSKSKVSWCNVGAHHCGHRNQGKTSWRWQIVYPGVVWRRCRGRHLEMQIHVQTDGKHPLDLTTNLEYGGGWARKTAHQSYHARNSEKVSEKTTPTSNVIRHSKSSAIDLFLVPEDIFGTKAPHKRSVDAVRAGLLNMSDQEENVGEDCLEHVFWGVLDDSCRHFSNPLSPEAEQERYMDPKIVWIPGTRLVHMADKLACNDSLMNVSVTR